MNIKLILRRLASSIAKITFPIVFTVLFLSPLFYYWGLLWFSGISSDYNSYFVIDREGVVKFQKIKPAQWTSVKEVPSAVIWPIIVSEDWGFYQHAGVDWQQLKLVLIDGIKNLAIKRGASTITQQVIKNLYLNDERSYLRKFNEIILAYYLESKVSKKWILEQYINLAEFDKNLYGIRNASRRYFQKSPSSLRFKEGAFLAMLLPSPKKYSVSFYRKDLTTFARKQVSRILGKLVIAKIITREQMQEELVTPFAWESSTQTIDIDVLENIIDKIKRGEELDEVETVDQAPAEESSENESKSNEEESNVPEVPVADENPNKTVEDPGVEQASDITVEEQ